MKFAAARAKLPSLASTLLAVFSAILLILAFPGFEISPLAYIALAPLFFAIYFEKRSLTASFLIGWIWGIVFIFGSCWWLTYSLIRYGGIPMPVAYFLLLGAAVAVGIFWAIFSALFSIVLKRFDFWGIFSAPFLWLTAEFLRFQLTGDTWNSVAYSQAFDNQSLIKYAGIGGIYLVGFILLIFNVGFTGILVSAGRWYNAYKFGRDAGRPSGGELGSADGLKNINWQFACGAFGALVGIVALAIRFIPFPAAPAPSTQVSADVVAIQANVPMSGLKEEVVNALLKRHVELSEKGLADLDARETDNSGPKRKRVVIFPESPMNFTYTENRGLQQIFREFTQRNNTSLLFNSAEPTEDDNGYYNAAVMLNEQGRKVAEYDKIHLVPFGEYVPLPKFIGDLVPTMAGDFIFGKNYNLMPFGDARGGMMICFESHFPNLSRRLVGDGADFLVEITNDGYLGPTPVLRQHLASTVFRAIETNRPVLRVTNVGITAYVTPAGEVLESSKSYVEDSRIWSVSKSDGSKTFYVQYGDWMAWLSILVSIGLVVASLMKRRTV